MTTTLGPNWRAYAACRKEPFGCGAEAGKPCLDRRSRADAGARHDYPRIEKRVPCKGRKMPCGPDWPPLAGDVWADDALRADDGGPGTWRARADDTGAVEFFEPGGPGRVPAEHLAKFVGSMRLMYRDGRTVPPPMPSLTAWGALSLAANVYNGVVSDPRGRGPRIRPGLRRAKWIDDKDRMTPLGYAVLRGWQPDGAGTLTPVEVTP
jgi:hypothetical protein